MMVSNSAPGRRITGWHVMLGMVGFFATIIAVDSVLVYRAVSTFGGVDTDDAYRKGLAYNRVIQDDAAQAVLGWSNRMVFEPSTGTLTVTILDNEGRGVDGLAVEAFIARLATNAGDRKLPLSGAGEGKYLASLSGLAYGVWSLAISAVRTEEGGAVVYRSKVRLWKQP